MTKKDGSMKPTITIDKYAIRFEDDSGATNHFFCDLFYNFPNQDWHTELMKAIQKAYEICVKEDIEPPKETHDE